MTILGGALRLGRQYYRTAPDWRDLALSGHITFPKPLGRGCLSTDPSVVHLHVIRNFLQSGTHLAPKSKKEHSKAREAPC